MPSLGFGFVIKIGEKLIVININFHNFLAACSSFFERIFASFDTTNPCKHPVIILPNDIKLWQIQALIDFMYKGEVNVTQQGLTNLLACAESLQIRGLVGSEAALNLKNTGNYLSLFEKIIHRK